MRVTPAKLSPMRLLRMFSSAAHAQRQRRPTDVAMLLLTSMVLVITTAGAPGPSTLDVVITDFIAQFGSALGWLWEISYALLMLWVVVLLVAPVVRRGRASLLWDYLLALALSFTIAAIAGGLGGTSLSTTVDALLTVNPPPVYAAVRLALVSAVVVTASPHLTRPFRMVGRVVLGLGAVASVALQVSHPSGVLAGLCVGLASAAIVHLVLGSPGGQLTVEQVRDALVEMGMPTVEVAPATGRAPGEQLVLARLEDGSSLEVKVFGRDAWDAQYVGSLWTALTRRGEAPRLAVSRRERIEHEAMVSLLAERAGAPVLPVVTAGQGVHSEELLVTTAAEASLAQEAGPEVPAEWLAGSWAALAALHSAGIAHRRITAAHIVRRPDWVVALRDLANGRIGATTADMMIDRAHLLVSLAVAAGPDRAVDSALAALGSTGLAESLPYLQDPVLSPPLRRALGTQWDLEHLRQLAIERTGTDPAPLVELRRVTAGSIVKILFAFVVVYSIVTLLAGVDFAEVTAAMASADLPMLVLALLVAPVAQVMFSLSTIGASIRALPYLPVLMLQYAIQFIALVLPSTGARVALQIRFFERLGVPYGAATTMGVVDSVGGFVVQVCLLLLILLSALPGVTTSVSAGSDSGTNGSEGSGIHWLVVFAVVVSLAWLVATLVVPRRRARLRRSIPRIRDALREQAGASRSALQVLAQPRKVIGILGGNLGGQLIQAVVLGICLAAFGESATLSQLVLVNTCVSLFAGMMPIPGGMGVAEAGYTYGLQAIGVPSAIAVSTAIAFRLVTFYLPPIWCSAAMSWLRRHAYV